MSFANFVQLYNLFRQAEICIGSSSPVAQHLTLNLATIRKIALKMKSTQELTINYHFLLDFTQTIHDSEFSELCSVLGRTYEIIHKQQKFECQTKKASMDAIRDLNVRGTPEGLLKFIDHALTNLTGLNKEENFFAT